MRTPLLVLLVSALAQTAAASERVTVAPPILNVVNNAQRLHDVCPADGEFDACTRFVAFRLTASCSRGGDGRWAMDASATFTPWIVAWHLASISHEQLHIGDIRESTERYIDMLTQESFVTRDACEAETLVASTTFGQKMREFARKSNEQRHRAILRASR